MKYDQNFKNRRSVQKCARLRRIERPSPFISIVDWLSCILHISGNYLKKNIADEELKFPWRSLHVRAWLFFSKIQTYVLLQLRANGGWYSWHGALFYVSFDGHCLAGIRTINDKSYHVSIDLGNRWAVYKTVIMSTDVFLEPQLTDNGK